MNVLVGNISTMFTPPPSPPHPDRVTQTYMTKLINRFVSFTSFCTIICWDFPIPIATSETITLYLTYNALWINTYINEKWSNNIMKFTMRRRGKMTMKVWKSLVHRIQWMWDKCLDHYLLKSKQLIHLLFNYLTFVDIIKICVKS